MTRDRLPAGGEVLQIQTQVLSRLADLVPFGERLDVHRPYPDTVLNELRNEMAANESAASANDGYTI